jgi:Tfp pilus assembly protein PilO
MPERDAVLFPQLVLTRILGVAGLLALLSGWWAMVGGPANETHQRLVKERIEIESLQQQQPVFHAALHEAHAKTAIWDGEAAKLRMRSIPGQDDIDFLDWINEQAQTTELRITDYRPSGRENVGDYDGRGLMLATTGSFKSICRFLEAMRHCPRMNRITSVEIVPQGSQRESFSMNLRVVLFTRSTPTVGKATPPNHARTAS